MIRLPWHRLESDEPLERPNIQHAFEDEVFFGLRAQRDNWAKVAVGAVAAAVMSIGCLLAILPLDETRPFVVMVDKTTGEAEKIVQVRPASLEQQDVVRQAELVSYVVDRETYDPADNPTRITDVMTRSLEMAADTLAQLWNATASQYPPTVYGSDVRIRVVVKSISIDPGKRADGTDLARVRITKIREEKGRPAVERSFLVTLNYRFMPRDNAKLLDVWKNPLGFMVTAYRVDAETAG